MESVVMLTNTYPCAPCVHMICPAKIRICCFTGRIAYHVEIVEGVMHHVYQSYLQATASEPACNHEA